MKQIKQTVVALGVLAMLAGCTGDDSTVSSGSNGYEVSSGLAQKGPLLRGSSVTVNELNTSTLQPSGKSYTFEVLDDLGTFKPSNITFSSAYLENTALGYYFNELTGQQSSDMVYLRGLSYLGTDKAVNLNVLSSFVKNRVKKLVTTAPVKTFVLARPQAEKELLGAFYIYNAVDLLPGTTVGSVTQPKTFMELDLSKKRAGDQILAAISGMVAQIGQTGSGVNYFLNQVETDLADDGLINNSPSFTVSVQQQLSDAAKNTDFAAVAANLNAFYKTNYTATDLSQWVDTSGGVDKVINKYKYSASNIPVGTESKSPEYVAGSEDAGQCFSVSAGKLYRNGSAVTTGTVKAVKGDKFVIGLTNTIANPKATAFIKRQPAVSSQCGSVTPAAVSLMKYTVALAQVDTVYLDYYVPTFKILANGNTIEQAMPMSAPYNSILQAKAPNGTILWSIKDGEISSSDIQWYDYTWRDLAIDVDGGIYWPNNSKLIKVSSSGAVVWSYQNPGYQFTKAIKLRGDGVLVTATNLAKPAISKISSSGSPVWKIDFLDSISDIKEGLDGSIYVTHAGSNSTQCEIGICNAITKLNSDGSFVWVKIFAVGDPNVFGTDSFLTEMAISPQGNIHVSGRGYPLADGNPFIMSISPQGEIKWIIYPNVSPMPAIRMQWREEKLYAILGDGYYSKSHLLKLNPTGVIESDIELDTVGYYTGPYAFDFDSAGNVIVSGHLENVGFYMRISN